MRCLVLGAGGIGGYFGGRLAQSRADVSFLVRDARAERLRTNGLVIESPLGDAKIDVQTITRSSLAGTYDLVLLSCKAYDLDSAIEALRPAVDANTSIIPLLNGLTHLDRLDQAFGAASVLGGLAHMSATLAPDGTVRHLNKLDTLTFGARCDDQGPRCEAIQALFATAAFTERRSDSIMQDMWEKFVFITAAAAITCLMRASVGAIVAARDGEALTLQLLAECNRVGSAAGFSARDKAVNWARSFLTERGSSFKASMLRDVEAGAEVEADHLQGDMIRRADALGIDVPLLRAAYCHLQSYQNDRDAVKRAAV